MLSRRLRQMNDRFFINGETHVDLRVETGEVAEEVIVNELMGIVFTHNPAASYSAERMRELGHERFQSLYALGPQLYKVDYFEEGARWASSRLGGIYVPEQIFYIVVQSLISLGYVIRG